MVSGPNVGSREREFQFKKKRKLSSVGSRLKSVFLNIFSVDSPEVSVYQDCVDFEKD